MKLYMSTVILILIDIKNIKLASNASIFFIWWTWLEYYTSSYAFIVQWGGCITKYECFLGCLGDTFNKLICFFWYSFEKWMQ